MTREKGREVERDGKVGKGRGGKRVEMILGSESLQNLRGTPFAIYDFGFYFTQKPLGGHPLRSVTVVLRVYKTLAAYPWRSMILQHSTCFIRPMFWEPTRFRNGSYRRVL